jgi:hypothetical protein
MQATHSSNLVGHPGYLKTYKKIREIFTWKGLKMDVLRFARECKVFQQNKVDHTQPTRLLRPLPILEQKWEIISMEFITGFPQVQGKDCIYVVVDRLMKFAHFFSIPSKYSAT